MQTFFFSFATTRHWGLNVWLLAISNFGAVFWLTGINNVTFDEEFKYIVAMKSVEGETVPLRNKVLLSNDVEVRKNPIQL